jgi:hypothetical protein
MGGLPLSTLMTIRPDLTGMAVVLGFIALVWAIFYGMAAVRSFTSPVKPDAGEAAEIV